MDIEKVRNGGEVKFEVLNSQHKYSLELSCEFMDTHALFGGTKMQVDQQEGILG